MQKVDDYYAKSSFVSQNQSKLSRMGLSNNDLSAVNGTDSKMVESQYENWELAKRSGIGYLDKSVTIKDSQLNTSQIYSPQTKVRLLCGKLFIQPTSAIVTKSTNLPNAQYMSPFCMIEIAKQKKKTEIQHNKGLNPKFNDKMVFEINGEEEMKR